MKIAVCGAGISGSYIYKLLKDCSYKDITIFDIEHKTNCGINPCAWGASKGFDELVSRVGLYPDDYILRRFDHLFLDDVKLKAYFLTFDKPKLIKDLLGGAEIKEAKSLRMSNYDKVIDATGVVRAYLPPIENDLISNCYQYRMTSDEPSPEIYFKLSKVGYAWKFPLSPNEVHVGAGSLVRDPIKILRDFGWISPYSDKNEVKCACYSHLRVTAPMGSRPFVRENVWGIGEAIGCVAPLAGDGIIPGMTSALILLKNIDSHPADYTQAILDEFSWMEKEREVFDRLRLGKLIELRSALVLQRNAKRMGLKIGLWDAFKILMRSRN